MVLVRNPENCKLYILKSKLWGNLYWYINSFADYAYSHLRDILKMHIFSTLSFEISIETSNNKN